MTKQPKTPTTKIIIYVAGLFLILNAVLFVSMKMGSRQPAEGASQSTQGAAQE